VSSSKLEGPEVAARLARKAQGDARAMRKLAPDVEIGDDIVGFHAQQAIEKWLKAIMASRDLGEARIHDIGRLVQLLEKDGVELPEGRDQLDELTIYAVPLRYDELLDAEPLDRDATVALVDGSAAGPRRSCPKGRTTRVPTRRVRRRDRDHHPRQGLACARPNQDSGAEVNHHVLTRPQPSVRRPDRVRTRRRRTWWDLFRLDRLGEGFDRGDCGGAVEPGDDQEARIADGFEADVDVRQPGGPGQRQALRLG
jgi:HEPN domain-containing protein